MKKFLDNKIREVYEKRKVRYGEKARHLHRSSEASKWFLGGLSALFFFSFEKFTCPFLKICAIMLAAVGIFSYSAAFFIFGREADKLDNLIESMPAEYAPNFKQTIIPPEDISIKGVIPYDLGIICLIVYSCLFFIGNGFFCKPSAATVTPVQNFQINNGKDSLKAAEGMTLNCKDCPGFTFTTHNIFFEFAKANILTDSYPVLDSIYHTMILNPGRVILIGAHTDSVGSIENNLSLSIRRATAVQEYLMKKGVLKHRLKIRGYSKIAPEESNATAAGRQANRRVEFTIIKN